MSSDSRATRRERMAATCRHFTGTAKDRCAAGVVYEDLAGGGPGWGLRLPCNPDGPRREGFERVECDSYEARGMEAVEAEERKFEAYLANVVKVIAAISRDGRDAGAIDCPVCDGRVTFSRVKRGWNFGCSTPECVRGLS